MKNRKTELICRVIVVSVVMGLAIFFGIGLYSKIAKTVDIITEKNIELFQNY